MDVAASIAITDRPDLCARLARAAEAGLEGRTEDLLVQWIGDSLAKAVAHEDESGCYDGRLLGIWHWFDERGKAIAAAGLSKSAPRRVITIFPADASAVAAKAGGYKVGAAVGEWLMKVAEACGYEPASGLVVAILDVMLVFSEDVDERGHDADYSPVERFTVALVERANRVESGAPDREGG